MTCPFCGGEMEAGFLRAKLCEGLYFEADKFPLSEQDVISLGETYLFRRNFSVNAFVCRSCKKLLMDYKE